MTLTEIQESFFGRDETGELNLPIDIAEYHFYVTSTNCNHLFVSCWQGSDLSGNYTYMSTEHVINELLSEIIE